MSNQEEATRGGISAPDVEMLERELSGFSPAALYVFGSAAEGRMRAGSDVDLAFLPDKPCDPVAVFDAAQRIAGRLGQPVDLVDLRAASTVMRKEVVHRGKLVVERDRYRRQAFEMEVLRDYAQLNEARQPVLRRLLAGRNP